MSITIEAQSKISYDQRLVLCSENDHHCSNSCHYLVLPEKRAHAVNGNNSWSVLELEPQHLNRRQQLERTSGTDDS